MPMLKSVLAMILALLILDALWISLFVGDLYAQQLGSMMKPEPDLFAALTFYLAYPLGAYFLAVKPAMSTQSAQTALLNGAILGAAAYGTFAVTNLAVLQGWSALLTVADVLWGIVVTAVVAALGYLAAR